MGWQDDGRNRWHAHDSRRLLLLEEGGQTHLARCCGEPSTAPDRSIAWGHGPSPKTVTARSLRTQEARQHTLSGDDSAGPGCGLDPADRR